LKQLLGVLILLVALAVIFGAGWLTFHLPQPH